MMNGPADSTGPEPDLLQTYAADGFVVREQFIPEAELPELLANLARFIADVVPSLPREHVFYEQRDDSRTLKQVQRMGDHDAWFAALFTAGPVRALAEQLLEGPVVPRNLQYFNKPAGVGQPTPPHQDGYYFMLDPCEAVTMWLALDHVDQENGCVRYVRGSHRCGMRPHARTETLGFSQGITDYPAEDDLKHEVAVIARPGDLLAHDAMTVHRADGNRSATRSRRALGFIYYSERAQEDRAAQAAYQQRLAEDMRAAGRI